MARVCAASVAVWAVSAWADGLPSPWVHVPINDSKTPTHYRIDIDRAATQASAILHARSDGGASLAVQPVDVDLAARPFVSWRWKILAQPDDADVQLAASEDAAARLLFFFDGARDRLPLVDRLVMSVADTLGTRPMPYATLMYVSAPGRREGEVIANPYTRRIQMIVADATALAVEPQWREFTRNLRDDYRRVFGEEPGRLLGWGLMTDSDNTRSAAEASYGAARFHAAP